MKGTLWCMAFIHGNWRLFMRIAQIAPLAESVPPTLYGGTERVVSWLTEELVRLGHEVTLFASGDSQTSAELVPVVPRALRLDPAVKDHTPYNAMLLDAAYRHAHRFDVMHFHIDFIHYPLFRTLRDRVLTTLHGRLDLPDQEPFYRAFPDLPLVSISDSQRKPMPPANWLATVHHGMPLDLHKPGTGDGGYLVFLGRICSDKGTDDAIAIAEKVGMPLKIAAKIDHADRKYFEERIRPLLSSPYVEFVGEIGECEKTEFLGRATALLFPIRWPEPFGLVMIEAMACGTPVIAYPCGAVPEVVEHGVTGFIANTMEEAADAVRVARIMDRHRIRDVFEARFSVERMTRDYVHLYEELLQSARRRTAA